MIDKNIIISNPENLEKIIKNISKEGKDKFHVIADFDRTLTQAFYKSQKASSIISHLRNGKYLTKDYASKAHALFDKYHPIEIDSKVPMEQKKEKMYEWWKAHKLLLIESGFDKKTIQQCVKDMIIEDSLRFRQGVEDFLNFLKPKNIPLVIMTSSLGDLVGEFMKLKNVLSKNVHIIANNFKFDENGNAIGIKQIIHVFNKDEMEVKQLPIYDELLKRKNVLLLGDSLGDIGMVGKFPCKNIIKVGFLNENVKENLEEYKKAFDIVITNDGDFDYVNKLIKRIIG